ncbi:MAG TPA: TIGR00153 family protein [Methanosarcinaceae archaeon]|nr:TIGR00153 family protein [Methanosarcinaceae archaeon]
MIKREYIRSVLNVFAESPFRPLHMHAEKGGDAVRKLSESVEAYCEGDMTRVEILSREIDIIEHEADVIKQTIRSQLKSSIMLPVNANDLLDFLKPQDAIPDDAQDVAYWLTLRQCELPDVIRNGLLELMSKTAETVEMYETLIDKLSELLETSFSKKEVKQTLAIVPQVEELEHEVDIIETNLTKVIFKHEDILGGAGVYHLTELVKAIGDIADKSEHAADRMRTMILRR